MPAMDLELLTCLVLALVAAGNARRVDETDIKKWKADLMIMRGLTSALLELHAVQSTLNPCFHEAEVLAMCAHVLLSVWHSSSQNLTLAYSDVPEAILTREPVGFRRRLAQILQVPELEGARLLERQADEALCAFVRHEDVFLARPDLRAVFLSWRCVVDDFLLYLRGWLSQPAPSSVAFPPVYG